ncbi:MAG: tetratricopeptide repeat protein [Fibrella sp.]|nr:tetratricopeptide repeat protein [Armatimonadota bacterium]
MARKASFSGGEVLFVLIAVTMLLVGRYTAPVLKPFVQVSSAGLNNTQQTRLDGSAMASLFGQFRTSMADFLWLKADRYLHNGVDMRGMTKWEQESSRKMNRVTNAGGKDGNREHHEETTAVPSAKSDWRGWLGDMDRQIKPFKEMGSHDHRDPKEALPLFRLMTISNPHFIPGYTVGAAMIARDKAKYPEAVAYLKEGVTNNPASIEVHAALGEMLIAKLRRHNEALPHLEKAIELAEVRDVSALSEDEKEAWQFAYRWAVLSRRESGDFQAAHDFAVAGLRRFPDDIVCKNHLKRTDKKDTSPIP